MTLRYTLLMEWCKIKNFFYALPGTWKWRWILRGLAIDIESSLLKLGHTVNRIETDLTNPDKPPTADYFLFVQQGQLFTIHRAWGFKKDLLAKSICIFTHYDHNNLKFDVLNKILLVLHMSTQQMATAIAKDYPIPFRIFALLASTC